MLVVDTDLPVVGQLPSLEAVSHDAAIDTLRVDAIDGNGMVFDVRVLSLPDPRDWPISIGVVGKTRLRIRGFRAMHAQPELVQGDWVLAPPALLTVDRLVDVEPEGESIRTLRVILLGDCLGYRASFLQPATTCIDAEHPSASPSHPLQEVTGLPPTRAGTWAGAQDHPCGVTTGQDKVCVPGGFSILGERALSGLNDTSTLDSMPLRPVRVSPFLMDATEFTVGRLRALAVQGLLDPGAFPKLPEEFESEGGTWCTWRGLDDPSNDALPVNCVTAEAARKACEAAGGTLPSEAQWEHAARGRGEARHYPWGEQVATCCAASVSRASSASVPVECGGAGPEPVGSHLRAESCEGLGDVSRDGVLDLAGSMSELVRDKFKRYDDACWSQEGVGLDPVCKDDTATTQISRGGSWNAGRGTAVVAFRFSFQESPANGFRCVYDGRVP